MDGATGLNKHNVTNYGTDAQWLTQSNVNGRNTLSIKNHPNIIL